MDRLITDFVLSVNKEMYMTTSDYINCTSEALTSIVGQEVTHLTIGSRYR
jgi:hypothetical protein